MVTKVLNLIGFVLLAFMGISTFPFNASSKEVVIPESCQHNTVQVCGIYAQSEKRGEWRCRENDPIGQAGISFLPKGFLVPEDDTITLFHRSFKVGTDFFRGKIQSADSLPTEITDLIQVMETRIHDNVTENSHDTINFLRMIIHEKNQSPPLYVAKVISTSSVPDDKPKIINEADFPPHWVENSKSDSYALSSTGLIIKNGTLRSIAEGETMQFYLIDSGHGFLGIWPSARPDFNFNLSRNFDEMGFLFLANFECKK